MRVIWSWLWRVGAAGIAYLLGAELGSRLAALLSLQPQLVPVTIEPARQWTLALIGGMVVAFGLAEIASGLSGSPIQRWSILAAFAFVVNGVSIALETRIFTTLGGELTLVATAFLSSALCALTVAWLFPAPDSTTLVTHLRQFVSTWRAPALAARLALALLAFPLLYLMFGAAVAPIVNPWYARLDFMLIPSIEAIVGTQLVRSILFLLVSIPIVICWTRPRARLILALGIGHFTAVGFSGLIQTPVFPFEMALAHTIEILGDSFAYSWVLTILMSPVDTDGARRSTPGRAVAELARALRVISAVLCFVAIGNWPPLFYTSVKGFVLISCVLTSVLAFRVTRTAWGLTFAAVAIVLNPLLPMPFPRQAWMVVDGIAGLLLLLTAITLRISSPPTTGD